MWKSEDEDWQEDKSVSYGVSRENNVCNGALHVIGLYGPGDKISLFLEDWQLARVALSLHIALDMLREEMHETRLLGGCCQRSLCVTARLAFLSRWMGCDTKGEGMW